MGVCVQVAMLSKLPQPGREGAPRKVVCTSMNIDDSVTKVGFVCMLHTHTHTHTHCYVSLLIVFFARALRCTCSTNVCSVSYKYKYTHTHTSWYCGRTSETLSARELRIACLYRPACLLLSVRYDVFCITLCLVRRWAWTL